MPPQRPRLKGWVLLYHQDLAECIVNHFKAILAHLDHMEGAEDTAPDGDLNPEETVS